MLERTAHAKINLALHVTGLRNDGYHLLDSLVVFSELGDKICITAAENPSSLVKLEIKGPFSKGLEAGANNLVSRAALAFGYAVTQKTGKPQPVNITLEKNLPIASGIGGGSADAAATLLVLAEFWNSDIDLEPIAKSLGADVSMCLHSRPLRAQGIGDEITLLDAAPRLNMVLVNPNVEVSTPAIFAELKEKNNPPITLQGENSFPEIKSIKQMRNDLQAPAIAIESDIAQVLEALGETDPYFFQMSGSGATCFALYSNQELAKEAAQTISQIHTEWWCVATQSTPA